MEISLADVLPKCKYDKKKQEQFSQKRSLKSGRVTV